MIVSLPERANLDQLKKQAKTLYKAFLARETESAARFIATHPRLKGVIPAQLWNKELALNDAQWVIAREYGFRDWTALKQSVLERDFFAAAREGSVDSLRKHLKDRPDLLERTLGEGPGVLHLAAVAGHADAVRFLLTAGADPSRSFGPEPLATTPQQLARDAEQHLVVGVFEEWLRRRADATTRVNPLIAVAEKGDIPGLRALLAETPAESRYRLVNQADERCRTALIAAVANSHLECVQLLLEAGADATYCPPAKGKTAIRRVVHHRCQDLDKSRQVLRLLLKHGAAHDHVVAAWLGDIEGTLAKAGRSPRRREEALIAAAQMGELPIVKRLLDLGVNPNTPRDVEAPSRPNGIFHEEAHAVWEASAQGHLEVVRELLRRGARPNAPLCASGWPISMARHYGHRGVEALLVSAGAPPPLNWDSDTLAEIQASLPLQMEKLHEDWAMPVASRTGRLDVIDYLLSLNPRIDDEMWAWCLRYTIAGESPNSPRILRKLIAHKANPNGRNSRGETPLHFVCMRQGRANPARLDNARVLMELGADPNIVDDVRQSTPLGYAAWAGDSALAEVLLKGGADPNLCGKPWAHPLRWAHKKGHAALAEMLKQHGAQEQDDHALPAA